MNLVLYAPLWLTAVFCLLLLASAAEDIWRLRISNWTCATALIVGLAAVVHAGLDPRLWQNAVVSVFLLVFGTVLFSLGKLGGGDAKLLAIVGLWFDIRNAGLVLLPSIFILGGLLALTMILARLARGKSADAISRKRSSAGLPYGVAIALGTFFALYTINQRAVGYNPNIPFLKAH